MYREVFCKNHLYLYFWPGWVFVAAPGLSLAAMWGLLIAVASLIVDQGL